MRELKIIGHRGARGLAPENTITSLLKALEYRVDMIEFDVRVSKDGVAVLHHNRTLQDASGNKLGIEQHTYGELKEHKTDLTTLDDALKTISGKTLLYIEVKRNVPIKPIVQTLKNYKHEFFLTSKSQKTLLELHHALPNVPKIVTEPWSGIRAIYRAEQLGTKTLSMNQLFLWSGFIATMKHRGYELYTYTLNDPQKAKRWAKYGLSGLVTDFPDRFTKL